MKKRFNKATFTTWSLLVALTAGVERLMTFEVCQVLYRSFDWSYALRVWIFVNLKFSLRKDGKSKSDNAIDWEFSKDAWILFYYPCCIRRNSTQRRLEVFPSISVRKVTWTPFVSFSKLPDRSTTLNPFWWIPGIPQKYRQRGSFASKPSWPRL